MPGAWELSKPSILVAVPHTGAVSTQWAFGLWQLGVDAKCLLSFHAGAPIDASRNKLVDEMEKNGCDWLFFLDSDVIPPKGTIDTLLSHNLPIVGGLYYTRISPIIPTVWVNNPDDSGATYIPKNFQPGEITEADAIGMGCCLIHKRVFDKLDKPYFNWTLDEDGNKGVSEDFYFCKKAKEAGFKIFVDTRISCEHMGSFNTLGGNVVTRSI